MRTVLLIGITTLLAGCSKKKGDAPAAGKSQADDLEKYGAEIAKRVATVEKLNLAAAQPAGAIPADLDFAVAYPVRGAANAVLLYDDELTGETTKRYASIYTYDKGSSGSFRASAMKGCRGFAALAAKPDPALKAKVANSTAEMERCSKLKYAVVIQVTKETKPMMVDPAPGTEVIKQFRPGLIDANVLVYALPEGKLVGGAKVLGESSPSLTPDRYQIDSLEDDLRFNFYRKLTEKLRGMPETKETKADTFR